MILRKNAIEPKQITQSLLDVTKFMPEKLNLSYVRKFSTWSSVFVGLRYNNVVGHFVLNGIYIAVPKVNAVIIAYTNIWLYIGQKGTIPMLVYPKVIK